MIHILIIVYFIENVLQKQYNIYLRFPQQAQTVFLIIIPVVLQPECPHERGVVPVAPPHVPQLFKVPQQEPERVEKL